MDEIDWGSLWDAPDTGFDFGGWLPAGAGSFWDGIDPYWEDLWNTPDNGSDISGWLPPGSEGYWDGVIDPSFWDSISGGVGGLGGLLSSPWAGLLLGGALGSIDGSKEAGTTTTTSAPWIGPQPYLLDLFRRAQGAADSTGTPSDLENSLYTQLVNLGGGGADEIIKTLRGDYMSPDNPVHKGIMDDALNQWNTSFMPGQMSGSYKLDSTGPLQANSAFGQNVSQGERAFGKAMCQSVAQNVFNPERQRQVAYASMVNPGTTYPVAQQRRYDPFNSIQKYGDMIRGSYGGVSTQPYYTNPYAGALGGGLMGSQIWNNLFNRG